jgi:hypothetical protein
LKNYNFDKSELSRIYVGADCNESGECRIKSANAPDPFFDKGTEREPGSYANTSDVLGEFVFNKVFGQTPANQKKWIPDGNKIKAKYIYPKYPNPKYPNSKKYTGRGPPSASRASASRA